MTVGLQEAKKPEVVEDPDAEPDYAAMLEAME